MGKQKTFNPEIKKSKTTKHPTFDAIVEAYIRYLGGEALSKIGKDLKLSQDVLEDRFKRLDLASNSKLPSLSMERQLINEVLSDKLKPIKEELSVRAVEILREADDIIITKLRNERDSLKLSDLVKAADSYEGRLARITGLEEDPSQGPDRNDRNNRVNIFIKELFPNHSDKLDNDRKKVNDIVVEGEVESSNNKTDLSKKTKKTQ